MKYCSNCGSEISENADVCLSCGKSVVKETVAIRTETDAPSGLFAVLSGFFPVIGLILYLVWKADYPLKAKSCGKGAIIGVIIYAVLFILYMVLMIMVFSTIVSSGYGNGSFPMGHGWHMRIGC